MLFSEAEMRKNQTEFSNILASNLALLVNNTGITSLARQMYQTQDQEKELDGFHSFDTSLN